MDFKKYMQKKQDENSLLTEGDEEFFNNVVLKDIQANAAARKSKSGMRTLWACVSASATALAAAVITVSVVFANRGPSIVTYQDENVVHIDSTFDELQNDLKFIQLAELSTDCSVNKAYDSESNDTLYYQLKDLTGFIELNFTIVINKNYNYKFDVVNETTIPVESYNITYTSEMLSDLTGIPKIQYRGWVNVETETVYFEYQQLLTMGDDAFFEGIQDIIKVK